MLQLKNIVKMYIAGDMKVKALKNVSLDFRHNEFVAVLGPSGCGKTTLLNIIGGLDRYTQGDLIINGISTKEYSDVDWDIYRNNSIGFVFQNYNLIPHQTVLSNVELAMTLAGVSKAERRNRAIEALNKVGLNDQLYKRPNQMSGGQMQRVAIARALVNNPDILLADEPTGALDSETSIQIMEILKEISKERLIIMVTHNSDLAETYATRTIKLLDGNVLNDDNPYKREVIQAERRKRKKVSMSFITALSLSLKNLLTKKTRTFLTSFAGSIGIIGIALILSLSSGMQAYIDKMQKDTLSTYPLQITSTSTDLSGMMSVMMSGNQTNKHDMDKIYSNNIMVDMMKSFSEQTNKNDLKQFKKYIESENGKNIKNFTNDIQYVYDLKIQIYKSDTSDGVLRVNPSNILRSLGMNMGGASMFINTDIWTEMINNYELLNDQYDIIGTWPTSYDEIVLIVDENNEISDYVLYSLGFLDISELEDMINRIDKGEKIDKENETVSYTYDELIGYSFKLLLNTDYYEKENGVWIDKSDKESFLKQKVNEAPEIKISGIVRPKAEVTATALNGAIGYTAALTNHVINHVNNSDIIKEQEANKDINVTTGLPFPADDHELTIDDVNAFLSTLPESERTQLESMISMMDEEQVIEMFKEIITDNMGVIKNADANLAMLGKIDKDSPNSINIYPKDYSAKDSIKAYINDYNSLQKSENKDEYVISYTDFMEIMMSSITSVINVITYVLIAFVAISLVVSSIMIGIITYISVLERTKEIGILRSIGASKHDISRVFNAETIIIGFVAGGLGIIITMLLNIPVNMIIKAISGVSGLSSLPILGGIALIGISMLLTVIAGLFPAKIAAKKDPVEALRTE